MVDWSETARFPAKLDRGTRSSGESQSCMSGALRVACRAGRATGAFPPTCPMPRSDRVFFLRSSSLPAGRVHPVINKQLEILALNLKNLK